MPAIRRTNVSRRTRLAKRQRYTWRNEIDDQRERRYEVKQNRNRQQMDVLLNPNRAAFNYNVEIDNSSQQIVAILNQCT